MMVKRSGRRLRQLWRESQFVPLFFMILLLILVFPVTNESQWGGRLTTDLIYTCVAIAAMAALARERKVVFRVAVVFGVISLVGRVAGWVSGVGFLGSAFFVFTALFYVLVVVLLMRRIMFARHVDGNTVFAAMCTYLLLGVVWFMAYAVIFSVNPDAFSASAELSVRCSFSQLFFFSFVTLTTLGYGEVTPLFPFAYSLAILEAITGQLFIAVLLSRLVALQIADRSRGAGDRKALAELASDAEE